VGLAKFTRTPWPFERLFIFVTEQPSSGQEFINAISVYRWRREEFLRVCSKEELAEKAQDIEVTIPVKKSQEARYNLDPGSFFENRFWGRRPDRVAINVALKILYILEFKRSTDRDEEF